MISIFVYGTLLVGESNHSIAAPFLLSVQPGAVFGRLYTVGPYPALALNQNDRVDGRAHVVTGEWFEVTEEGLQAMDSLEDYHGPGQNNEYERVWVRDISGSREGWVYIWEDTNGLEEISGGSWRVYRSNV